MKLKPLVLATILTLAATSAHAGRFVPLNSGVNGVLSSANNGLQNGANNPAGDRFYIDNLASSIYLPGRGYGSEDTIASVLNYRSFVGTTTIGTGSLTLLDWSVTNNFNLVGNVAQGKVYDFVYRDSADGKLVFGTRFINQTDNNQEANYLFRGNLGSSPVSTAWTSLSDFDLRMYQAGRTNDYTFNTSVPFVDGFVRQKADVSVTESNPWSGLYLVKTNFTNYTIGANAIGIYQAGEEGQAVAGSFINGFVGTNTIAAIPETDTYAMLLAGLGVMGLFARRKHA